MHRLGVGTTHQMHSVITGIALPSLTAADYHLSERIDLWRRRQLARTTSYALARAYAHRLQAPQVGFYTVADSAPCPAFEEPDRALSILVHDVLGASTALADPT